MGIIHYSDDPNDFRNKKYLDCMEEEFHNIFRAYHKYISYRKKLLHELTMNQEQKEVMANIDEKFVRNLERAAKRIQKVDFKLE